MKKIYPELVAELTPLVDQHNALKERVAELEAQGCLRGLVPQLKYDKLRLKERMGHLIARYHPADHREINPHLYILSKESLGKLYRATSRAFERAANKGPNFESQANRDMALCTAIERELARRSAEVVQFPAPQPMLQSNSAFAARAASLG